MNVETFEKLIKTELLLTKIKRILYNNTKFSEVYNSLTNMEKKVLKLILSGKNNREIATSLCRSRRTVENHRLRLMKKLSANNAITLALNAHSYKIYKHR